MVATRFSWLWASQDWWSFSWLWSSQDWWLFFWLWTSQNTWSFCRIWASQKLNLKLNSLRRDWMSEQLSGLLIHATSTPTWLFILVKVSTSSDLYPDYFRLPTFLDCSGIQFSNLPPFPAQSVRLPLVTFPSLCSTCVTYRTPCHANNYQVLLTQPLHRKTEDFPRNGKHSKHVLLLTYLTWLQPIINNSILIFKQVKTKDALLVVKSLIKNNGHINQQSWISSYFNQLPKVIIKHCSLKKHISKLLFHKTHLSIAPSKLLP